MKLSTNTAAVLIVGIAAFVAVLYGAPPDLVREAALGVGSGVAFLLASLKPLLRRDENRDGVPDVLEPLLPGSSPEEEE